ncbi:MAG: single-stranded DNA-binding protein [Ginsengibacter sp.]
MIKLQIIGHLGNDCTQNEVNGKTVINFNVAHSEKYKDAQGNLVEKTTWVKCAYWTDRTAIAQYLTKGKMVYAEGTPEAEGFLSKDNQNAASLKMRVFQVQLLGSKNDNAPAGSNPQTYAQQSPSSTANQQATYSTVAAPQQQAPSSVEEPADDLPF